VRTRGLADGETGERRGAGIEQGVPLRQRQDPVENDHVVNRDVEIPTAVAAIGAIWPINVLV